jgi:hypothetical protein
MFRPSRFLSAACAVLLFAGCGVVPKPDPARTGPFYTPANVRGVDRLPTSVTRIALLPCAPAAQGVSDDTLRDLDRVLAAALTRAARAEITPVDPVTFARLTGHPRMVSTAILPSDFLARIATQTGADALLLVDITTYSPYPPLSLGLRARLIDIKTGVSLWNFDNILSTATPAVVNSARAHHLGRTPATMTPGNLSYSVLQNPLMFADYVAHATWATLPPR